MFKNLLIGTALTLVAATSSITPALAKSIPLRYSDPCKTAFENFNQAQWEDSHTTDQNNPGGAAGWDELADAAEQNAKTQHARAEERRAKADSSKPSPNQSDFWNKRAEADADYWNKQADEAEAEAKDWEKTAKKHRAKADEMRADAKDYDQAAWKALAECWKQLAGGTVHGLPGVGEIRINGKLLSDSTEQSYLGEPMEPEKKPGKKIVRKTESGGGKIKTPKAIHVKKPDKAMQNAANDIAREVAVSVARELIFGATDGMEPKEKKYHKLERRQAMEVMPNKEDRSRRKMKLKIGKLMVVGAGMF